MLAWGLWSEFSKLPHVTLAYQNSDEPLMAQPPVDFCLMHCYFSAPIFMQMDALRALTNRKIINFMEIAHDEPPAIVDYNFTYLPRQPRWGPTEQVSFPYVGSLLNAAPNVEKWAKSVLLDHSSQVELLRGPEELWCSKLHSWLGDYAKTHKVAQLRRNNVDVNPEGVLQGQSIGPQSIQQLPEWVGSVPEACYPEYLERTAPYENFILTHPGSYEHSIIDMVARDIRVLVPMQNGRTFAPAAIVEQMNLETFQSREQLLTILDRPFNDKGRRKSFCTDMPEIVRRVDAYCQQEMIR